MQSDLVAGVAARQGAFWEAVHEIREGWNIEALAQIPSPTYHEGGYYVPAQLAEEPQQDDAGHEEWLGRLKEWDDELADLHRKFVPEACREPVRPDELNWLKFLSGCILFDPPTPMRDNPQGPGLIGFRDALNAPRVSLRLLSARGSAVPNSATGPLPFAWVRDARDVEERQRKRDLLIIAALLGRYGVEERRSPEEVLDDLLTETPGLTEALRTIDDKNPPRLVIDPKPHNSQEEVVRAWDVLRATHAKDGTTTSGRRRRDPLEDAEAAILAKQHGWSYEELADRYKWRYPTHASKVIPAGEAILFKL